jgi:hypothetical protein
MEPDDKLLRIRKSETESGRRIFIITARIVGVFAAALVIVGQSGPSYLGVWGKIIFWTALVVAPLLLFNKNMLGLLLGKVITILLLLLHVLFVVHWFGSLEKVNFAILALVALGEGTAFASILMIVRRQHTGIWY